jgi:hypothetical protein
MRSARTSPARAVVGLLLGALLASGCSIDRKVKKLDNEEFQHYYALKVWMDDGEKKAYFKNKTRAERDAWLKEKGLWDKFYQYEPHIREQIYGGEVQVGWTRDMLLMAWGKPIDRGRPAGRKAQRSVMFLYRFEQTQDGAILVWEPGSKTEYQAAALFRREVYIDDGVVAEIRQKNGF